MNEGVQYSVANAPHYAAVYRSGQSSFDVYSEPIVTRYSQVHWRSHHVKLPDDIVQRFGNQQQMMAVTGYEVDQVRRIELDDGSTGTEQSVPITWAYNHHYTLHLVNDRQARMVLQKTPLSELGLHHGASQHLAAEFYNDEDDHNDHNDDDSHHDTQDDDNDDETTTHVQYFSEANGGEMRGSYHGYPTGYAQIIQGPTSAWIIPMQIDTWHRQGQAHGEHKFVPGPLPRRSQINSTRDIMAAGYNTLIECPCSDRLAFVWHAGYALADDPNYHCQGPVVNATTCFAAVPNVVPSLHPYRYVNLHNDAQFPTGCSVQVDDQGHVQAVWNEKPKVGGGGGQPHNVPAPPPTTTTDNDHHWVGMALGVVNLTMTMDTIDDVVHLQLRGPADAWFGVGFGSNTMCLEMEADECPTGGPYAVIILGDGTVEERKLDHHGPGVVLTGSVTVVSNTVNDDTHTRTVQLVRSLTGPTDQHYTFAHTTSSIPLIMAKGCGPTFAQHCGHGPSRINLLPVNTPTALCATGIQGTIDGDVFASNRCSDFPKSDLLVQNNPTCHIETYMGGLSCCRDGKSLLDKDQPIPWPDQPLEYRLKFRFYYEEYQPATATSPASHQQLVRLYWTTEDHAGEYDIVKCPQGTPPSQCVQIITSRWKVRDMLHDCPMRDASRCTGTGSTDPAQTKGVQLVYAGPHCHAGTCLSMDLYNADTGRLLCHVEPTRGTGTGVYDEYGFLAIPPCLWGDAAEGLLEPELLSLDTTLLSIKRNNSTFPHTGEMASWQMRGVIVRRSEHDDDDDDDGNMDEDGNDGEIVIENKVAETSFETAPSQLRRGRPGPVSRMEEEGY